MPNLDELYRAGIRLHQAGRSLQAAQVYDAILAQQPDHYGALHLKGVLALQAGDYDVAIALIERSLAAQPQHSLALSNLAVALRAKGRMLDAIAALEKSVALDPNSADAWTNLANTQSVAGLTRASVESARRAVALAPDRLAARHAMIFGTNYLAEIDPLTLTAEARDYGAIAQRLMPPREHHNNVPRADRRLKVGLSSADFRAHPVGRFLLGVLAAIDPDRLELHAYSDVETPDALTARFREFIPSWHDVAALDDKVLGERIVADGIDVMVDLSGHTARRLLMFAGKPAPVSFTWLGYFATTGLTSIDYVLANKWVIPEDEENQWVETPWRMPDTYLCFTEPSDAPPPGPLPALRNGHVTFGCFNNFNKLNERTLAAWGRLLEAVPGSRLKLRSSGNYREGVVQTLEAQLAVAGIDRGRVEIDTASLDYEAHLASYEQIDIALDPFPYNGGTTTVEALYMGVPVLVRAGDRYVAHMGESILHNVGLPQWIAASEAEYPVLGARFAADLDGLAALRANLRERMLASPLFDVPRFARNFEDAIRGMWKIWCAAQRRA